MNHLCRANGPEACVISHLMMMSILVRNQRHKGRGSTDPTLPGGQDRIGSDQVWSCATAQKHLLTHLVRRSLARLPRVSAACACLECHGVFNKTHPSPECHPVYEHDHACLTCSLPASPAAAVCATCPRAPAPSSAPGTCP